jgi:hypothetical protein
VLRVLANLLLRRRLAPKRRIVRVKSWRPVRGEYGWEWPCVLTDAPGGQRETVWPIWTWPTYGFSMSRRRSTARLSAPSAKASSRCSSTP